MSHVMFTAQKDEGPFLLEWIAYHRVIGFDKFVICSNSCTDGSDKLLDELEAAGVVRHIRHTPPENVAPQLNASRVATREAAFSPGDWVMWLDSDEFLNIKCGDGKVNDLLAETEGADGVAISWRIFGDSGLSSWPGRHLTPQLNRASKLGFGPNKHVKTIFKFDERVDYLEVHRPVIKREYRDSYIFVNGSNNPVDKDFQYKMWGGGPTPFHEIKDGDRHALCQVNHYAVRTPDIYQLRKRRGRGNITGSPPDRYNSDHYQRMNRNGQVDESILRWSKAVEAEEMRLRGLVTAPTLNEIDKTLLEISTS